MTPTDTALSVDVPEAARRIGVCASTVKQEIASGRLRSFTVGRRRLVRVVDIVAYLERRVLLEPVKGPQR